MCHETGQSALRMDASCWLSAKVRDAAQHGVAGDEEATRASFDSLWSALQGLDRMNESCMPKLIQLHEAMLADVYRSTSWRITALLRASKRVIR
jgi:hypothetical protein